MNRADDITPVVRDWLHEPATLPTTGIERVAQQVHRTPQQRRWLPPLPRLRDRPLVPAIVIAVLGGAALAGGALQMGGSSSPTDVPLALETVEVEPGVERVVADLAGNGLSGHFEGVFIEPDGAVWVSSGGKDRELFESVPSATGSAVVFRLGEPAASAPDLWLFPLPAGTTVPPNIATPDPRTPHILSFGLTEWSTGESWMPRPVAGPPGDPRIYAMAQAPDGTIWAVWFDPDQEGYRNGTVAWDGQIVLGRYDGSAWSTETVPPAVMAVIPKPFNAHYADLAVDGDGTVWLSLTSGKHGNPPGALVRFAQGAWGVVDPIGDGADRAVDHLATAPDGTLWVHLHGCVGPVKFQLSGTENPCAVVRDPYLAHLVRDAWTIYSSTDGVPMLGHPGGTLGDMAIAPDGTVWMSASCQAPKYPCDVTRESDVLHAFGKDGWRSYLDATQGGGEIYDLDVGPDGKVWVALDYGIYRIDPTVASGGHTGGAP